MALLHSEETPHRSKDLKPPKYLGGRATVFNWEDPRLNSEFVFVFFSPLVKIGLKLPTLLW